MIRFLSILFFSPIICETYNSSVNALLVPIDSKIFIYNNQNNTDNMRPSSVNTSLYFPGNRLIPGNLSYDYSSSFNSTVSNYCISYVLESSNPILVGFNRQVIDDIFDTSYAWNDNGDGIPHFNEINYDAITNESFDFSVVSMVMQKSRQNHIIGIGTKIFRQNYSDYTSLGFSTDIGINYIHRVLNLHFGVKNVLNYNRWNSGETETFIPTPFIGSKIFAKGIGIGSYFMYQNSAPSLSLAASFTLNNNMKMSLFYSLDLAYAASISFANEYIEFSLSSKFYNNGFINDNINFSFGILPSKINKLDIRLVP